MDILRFDIFNKPGLIHGCSTKSWGKQTNFELFAKTLGSDINRMVFSKQTHSLNIRKVTSADKGKGPVLARDYDDVDGMITSEAGIMLVCFTADCVPVLLYDPKTPAIGVAHAGWRGTLGRITALTIEKMTKEFGTNPKDILAGIGPSIGPCCFEVGPEVYTQFEEHLPYFSGNNESEKPIIDLWETNRRILESAGVPSENIEIMGLCTKCRQDLFYSHRVSGTDRGAMTSAMEISL